MLSKKSLILCAMVGSGALNGIGDFLVQIHGGNPQALFVPSVVIWAILIKMWFTTEWEEKKIQPSGFYRIGVWALAFIAVPWYFLKYRGLRNGSIAIALTVGVLAAERVAYIAAWYATQAVSI